MKSTVIVALLIAFFSINVAADDSLICSRTAAGKAVAKEGTFDRISAKTIDYLRTALSEIFVNSDQVLLQYVSRSRRPVSVRRLGSIGASSFGLFDTKFGGIRKETILKVPQKYPLETLFDYFTNGIPRLPDVSDPMDFSDRSPKAIHQRRSAGMAILLQHFFRVVQRETGLKITPNVLFAFSNREVLDLIQKFPEMNLPDDERTRSAYQNLPPGDESERSIWNSKDLVAFGVVFEKLRIAVEERDRIADVQKTSELGSDADIQEFSKVPGVRSQVIVIAWLLSQVGIEIADANPVLAEDGRVNLLDLDDAIVAIRVNGKVVFISNAPEKIPYYRKEYEAGNWNNGSLLRRGGFLGDPKVDLAREVLTMPGGAPR